MSSPQRHTQCQGKGRSKVETLLMERLKAGGDYQSLPFCFTVPLNRAQGHLLPVECVVQGDYPAVAPLAHFCSL